MDQRILPVGQLVECMANSDNVMRAGLTPKPLDVPSLTGALTYNQGRQQTTSKSCDCSILIAFAAVRLFCRRQAVGLVCRGISHQWSAVQRGDIRHVTWNIPGVPWPARADMISWYNDICYLRLDIHYTWVFAGSPFRDSCHILTV